MKVKLVLKTTAGDEYPTEAVDTSDSKNFRLFSALIGDSFLLSINIHSILVQTEEGELIKEIRVIDMNKELWLRMFDEVAHAKED